MWAPLNGAQASEEPVLAYAALLTAAVCATGLLTSFWAAGDVWRDRKKKKQPTPIATTMTAKTVPTIAATGEEPPEPPELSSASG